jgi:hypothetical protein
VRGALNGNITSFIHSLILRTVQLHIPPRGCPPFHVPFLDVIRIVFQPVLLNGESGLLPILVLLYTMTLTLEMPVSIHAVSNRYFMLWEPLLHGQIIHITVLAFFKHRGTR